MSCYKDKGGGERSQNLLSLAQRLRLYKPPPCTTTTTTTTIEEDTKRAAVLVCIFEGDAGDLRVILTKRSSRLSSHSGEVALPGGKREETDANDIETALREAKEEIGLDPSLVEVVAVFESFLTFYGLTVVPVVGILYDKAFRPVLDANEVESVFDVPLQMFLKDENRRAVQKNWMGENYLLHFFDFQSGSESYVIWALTAGILIRVASVVYQQPPAFLEMKPPFWHGVPRL